jgi:hypothetical protein
MPSLRLNIFQRLVRQWDQLHPYNAAQVMKIAGRADVESLRNHFHAAVDTLGLGRVCIDGQTFRYEHLNGESMAHDVRAVENSSLEAFISDELNRPFPADRSFPFRPFLIQEQGWFYAGIVYHHWVADSASIRLLLREWFLREFDPKQARKHPVRMPHGGYWHFFSPKQAKWRLDEGILSSIRWSSRFKRVRRIEGPGVADFQVKFTTLQTPPGFVHQLRDVARAEGLTVNDLFLCAIAEACDRYVPLQYTPRRQDLALGTIVDLRPHVREDLSDMFGLFLGFTSVICRPRDLKDWNRLKHTIATQGELHKQTGVPLASVVRMLAGLAAGSVYSREKVINFYRKRVPLAGGISNVNLSRSWAANYFPDPLLDYVRVSPTGPMMPLVFTPTTLGDRLNVGLTYRTSIIPDETARSMAESFVCRLRRLTETRQASLAT